MLTTAVLSKPLIPFIKRLFNVLSNVSQILDPDSSGGGGLFLGSVLDSKHRPEIENNKISHVISLFEGSKPVFEHIQYKCIDAIDSADFDLSVYFSECIDFIHNARASGGNILVHCIAGVSRSTTIVVAYLLTVTDLDWEVILTAVQARRPVASPNHGFRRQLIEYQENAVAAERTRIKHQYPFITLNDGVKLLEILQKYLADREEYRQIQSETRASERIQQQSGSSDVDLHGSSDVDEDRD